jgi:hypothetical protein
MDAFKFIGIILVCVVVALGLAWLFSGHEAESTSRVSTSSGLTVGRLGTVDGCAIYRFEDAGHYHYFVRCGGSVTTSGSRYDAATKTTQVETIQTE